MGRLHELVKGYTRTRMGVQSLWRPEEGIRPLELQLEVVAVQVVLEPNLGLLQGSRVLECSAFSPAFSLSWGTSTFTYLPRT